MDASPPTPVLRPAASATAAAVPAWRRHLVSAGRVFPFFLFLGRRSRKARVFVLLALFPVAVAALVKMRDLSYTPTPGEMMSVFMEFLMALYLQLLVVILAIFYGTSVTSEEVDGRTLPYLTTRPLTKPGIILGKYAAYTVLTSAIVTISLTFSFFILNSRALGRGETYAAFFRYAGVLVLGLAAYMAFFTFLGAVVRRSIFLALVFGYGWENVISYFPGSTQKFSIVHYLKSLLPAQPRTGRFSFLMFRLEPTPPLKAVLVLLAITAVALILASVVFRWKEYLFED